MKDFSKRFSLALTISTIVALIYFAFFTIDKSMVTGSDLVSFITGASVIYNKEGSKLYDLETQRRFQRKITLAEDESYLLPFRSLPFVSLFFLPFLIFPIETSYRIFVLINIVVLIVFVLLIGKIFKKSKIGLWSLMPFMFYPSISIIILGQISFFVFISTLLIYKWLNSKKILLVGTMAGLVLIKFQFITLIPFLLILAKEKKQFLKGFITVSLMIIFLSVSLTEGRGILNYINFLSLTENPDLGSRYFHMFSLTSGIAFLYPHFLMFKELLLVINGSIYFLVLILFKKRFNIIGYDLAFASLIIFSLAFSTHTLSHDLVLLLIPIFILLERKLTLVAVILFIIPWIILSGGTFLAPFVLLLIGFYILFQKVNISTS